MGFTKEADEREKKAARKREAIIAALRKERASSTRNPNGVKNADIDAELARYGAKPVSDEPRRRASSVKAASAEKRG